MKQGRGLSSQAKWLGVSKWSYQLHSAAREQHGQQSSDLGRPAGRSNLVHAQNQEPMDAKPAVTRLHSCTWCSLVACSHTAAMPVLFVTVSHAPNHEAFVPFSWRPCQSYWGYLGDLHGAACLSGVSKHIAAVLFFQVMRSLDPRGYEAM